jgi:hypothetical protein
MSKWIKKDLFNDFQNEKKKEIDRPAGGQRRSEVVWQTPEKGTVDRPRIYTGRFLADKKGNFYKKYHYHMFQSGEKWVFILCPKTYNFDNFCALCSVTKNLYQGSAADKKQAYQYKRKEKYVCNFYITDDPRDQERDDEKVTGTVKLYEFPSKVEMKLRAQIIDTKHGLGPAIFDPGPDGYDFILKVFATKRDERGNVWPDYSQSEFARTATPIAPTDREIKEILEQTIDVDAYIQGLEKPDEDIIAILKNEMLWELVKDEWTKYKGSPSLAMAEKDEAANNAMDSSDSEEATTPAEDDDIPSDNDDEIDDDEALLEELKNI